MSYELHQKHYKAATAIADAADTGDEAIVAAQAGLRLLGWSVRETAAAVATLDIENGESAGSPDLAVINLAASESKDRWYGERGIAADGGIFVNRLTGTTLVIIYYVVET